MLDISRDKVYKLETVKLIVDMLASFKYNQLQLYLSMPLSQAIFKCFVTP